jgi:hypothetical protein
VLNSGSYTPDAEDFEQTWLAVPLPRDLFPQSGPDHTPVARLEPGTWYLAVAPFHEGLLVEVNGVRGVLYDLDGIQRGE